MHVPGGTSPADRPDGRQGCREEAGGFGRGNAEQPQVGFGGLIPRMSRPPVPDAARATAAARAGAGHGAERDLRVGDGDTPAALGDQPHRGIDQGLDRVAAGGRSSRAKGGRDNRVSFLELLFHTDIILQT